MALKTYKITYQDKDYIVKAYKGVEESYWGGNRFKHKVTIESEGELITFTFHNSINAWLNNHQYLKVDELRDALESYLCDATCYINSPTMFDFLNDFGYGDCDSKEGKAAFKGCLKAYGELKSVFKLTDEDIFGLTNAVREEENNSAI